MWSDKSKDVAYSPASSPRSPKARDWIDKEKASNGTPRSTRTTAPRPASLVTPPPASAGAGQQRLDPWSPNSERQLDELKAKEAAAHKAVEEAQSTPPTASPMVKRVELDLHRSGKKQDGTPRGSSRDPVDLGFESFAAIAELEERVEQLKDERKSLVAEQDAFMRTVAALEHENERHKKKVSFAVAALEELRVSGAFSFLPPPKATASRSDPTNDAESTLNRPKKGSILKFPTKNHFFFRRYLFFCFFTGGNGFFFRVFLH